MTSRTRHFLAGVSLAYLVLCLSASAGETPKEPEMYLTGVNFELRQRTFARVQLPDKRLIGVYLGDVNLLSPSEIVLFDWENAEAVVGSIDDIEKIRKITKFPVVALDSGIKTEGNQPFDISGKHYAIKSVSMKWSLLGDDYMTFQIQPRP